MLNLCHLFTSFRSMGGVEAVLRHHHAMDLSRGIASRFIVYAESDNEPLERLTSLGFTPTSSIARLRRSLGRAIQQAPPEVAVYHGPWGMPYMVDLDRASRRILVMHGILRDQERVIRSRWEWLDGVLCVNDALREVVCNCIPRLAPDRVQVVCAPISPPTVPAPRQPLGGRPMIIGYCGRLCIDAKRVDKLRPLCVELDRSGLDYRFELLGEGPERNHLEGQFADRSRFIFHGRKSGDDYWRILSGWDAILFVSDTEGTPVGLLEALSMGVIPVYPRIGSGGDAYTLAVKREFLYEPNDFAAVTGLLKRISSMNEAELGLIRERCRVSVAGHLGDNYMTRFSEFVAHIRAQPRVSCSQVPRRPWPLDHLPMTWIDRISRIRRAMKRQNQGRPEKAA